MSALAPKPAIAAAAVSAEWIAVVREIAQRDGHALRAGEANTIEVQSINQPDLWLSLQLPGDGQTFTTAAERDEVLRKIQEGR